MPCCTQVYPQGKMSQAVAKLEEGQTMLMRGPKVSFLACASNAAPTRKLCLTPRNTAACTPDVQGRLRYKPNMKKHIGE